MVSREKDEISRPTVERENGLREAGGGGIDAADRAMSSCVADTRGWLVLLSLEVSKPLVSRGAADHGS